MPPCVPQRFFAMFVALFLNNWYLNAQLCTGSLGDPVVNITFGTEAITSNDTFTSFGYTFVNSTCPNDGYYTITNYTTGCFDDKWFTLDADHTGNHGNYMLVNASYEPGDFFKTTVSNLCPNTNYQFSAWICNLLRPSIGGTRPNITFTIETVSGVILQQYQSGDISESSKPEWRQFGFYFSSPTTNDPVVLRMTNNAPGGTGNDLALDDITFRPCGATITSHIQGNADTLDLCSNVKNQLTFQGIISQDNFDPFYQWQVSVDSGKIWTDIPGATSNTYKYDFNDNVGVYYYRQTVSTKPHQANCRIASNNLVLKIHSNPIIDAGPNRTIIAGDTIHFSGKIADDCSVYYWHPGESLSDAKILNPVATPRENTEYSLFGESVYGCKNNDRIFVKVIPKLFIPTAFTPNNDGVNDHWHISLLDPLLGADVSVYNRYGNLVYHSKNQIVDWDGTVNGQQQPSAVYIYQIKFQMNRPVIKGTVTLIR